ncbi:MAG: lytic transglycosylase domain-containing protein [Bacteroidetes bacterium]|jgi:membrane-bound lytic murein transglycosylase D|nr:lytic transglycosylase domain-containing protein [Bacteroidota bacterium]MBT6687536.1 lytic transglycosylase domain-containing protein [Bacteroidota bacterium]MBT7142767.1 lytic transglycosylase domain-containing protein [Bacteroidota bacterium]MBT7491970.1 lytic transglycosylase domain-containing protein [Bacteroidota bacterium]
MKIGINTLNNLYKNKLIINILYISIVFSLLFTISNLFIFSASEEPSSNSKNKNVFSPIEIPKHISFANEKVPVKNFDVSEGLDRELLINTYWHSQTFLHLKKANRYFKTIEPILKKNNIPDDFKYLAIVESGLSNVTSPAGAVGFWQFLKGTAKETGLEVNSQIDERYHLEKATQAACKYFNKSYEKYKNWTLAAASYNIGRRRLSEELERQKAHNYYDLLLNEETSRYIFRAIATKIIFQNPAKYSFDISEKDYYPFFETKEIKVDSAVSHFADFAKIYGTNYKILKVFNPWLRNHYLTNKSRKEYFIKIPVDANREIEFEE